MPSTSRASKKNSSTLSLPKVSQSSSHEYLDFPVVDRNAPIKPNKQYYVEALAKGQTIGIHSLKEYPTFFKLFRRYCDRHRLKMRLHVRQTLPDVWLLIPRKENEDKPDVVLEGDWREHGRYKYYAVQLEQGSQLSFTDPDEANKARRAWMLYTPRKKRADRECLVTKLPRSGKIVVSVQEKSE
ncbi:hypothetical protein DB347_17400 [Opitutaceae bacterium EW11]|nr:hypothetical protein DB347_17400 [Opitutaceae bacterium EW11]